MKWPWAWILLAFMGGLSIFPLRDFINPPQPAYPNLSEELKSSQTTTEQIRKELQSVQSELTKLQNERLAEALEKKKAESGASVAATSMRPEMSESMKKAMEFAGKSRLAAKIEAFRREAKIGRGRTFQ